MVDSIGDNFLSYRVFLTHCAGNILSYTKLLLPSESHVLLHGEGDEGGGQVAGEGKAESVKLGRVVR